MTPEQKKAVAIAKAKRARAEAEKAPSQASPSSEQSQFQQPFGANDMAIDRFSFGMIPRAASGLNALVRAPFTDKSIGEEYSGLEAQRQAAMQRYQEESPKMAAAASIAGSVAGMGKLAGMGVTASRFLPQGAGLLARGAAGAADSVVLNEAMNANEGRDFGENAGLSAVVGAAAPGAGDLIAKGASKALGMFNKAAPPQMDAEALKQAAQAAYSRADDAGVVYTPEAVQRIAKALKGEFADFGFHPELQSGAKVALGEVDRLGQGNVTLKGIDTARKIAGNAFIPGNASNNALTGKVASAIDDLVQNPQAGDILTGDAGKASEAIKEARNLYGRSAKLNKVNELFGLGELNASTSGSGGNLQNATRQQLKRVLRNKGWDRGFTVDEKEAIKSFAKGTTGQNTLRAIGAMSPSGNGLGKMLWGGAGIASAASSPATLIPLALGAGVTAASKKGGEAITRKSFEKLQNLIASGGNAAALQAPKNATQKAIERNKQFIARLLMAGGLSALPQNGQP